MFCVVTLIKYFCIVYDRFEVIGCIYYRSQTCGKNETGIKRQLCEKYRVNFISLIMKCFSENSIHLF